MDPFIQLDSEHIMGFYLYACVQIKQAICVISYCVLYLHNQTCFVLVLHKVTDLYFKFLTGAMIIDKVSRYTYLSCGF